MENNIMRVLKRLGFLFISLVLLSCTDSGELLESDHQVIDQNISLYSANLKKPWHTFIQHNEKSQIINGSFTELLDGSVQLTTTDKDGQAGALNYKYKDTQLSRLYFSRGQAIDLTPYVKEGAVTFDIRVDNIEQSAFDLAISCGEGCSSKVRLREWAQSKVGQGWQKLSIPIQCFTKEGADFSQVEQPFSIETGGEGQLAIANIGFQIKAEGNFDCPDFDLLPITPDTLNEFWSAKWWLTRHKEKVALAKQGNIDLLLVGDSITHGWEDVGKAVWQQHFSDVKTLNIGFSGDRTENVLWRLQHDAVTGIAPKLTVVMIGSNNTGHRFDQPANIAKGVYAIINQLKQRLPQTKILLLAIFPRGVTADDKLRINNKKANVLLKAIASKEQVLFANFNQEFLSKEGQLSRSVMPDLLHPNKTGYEIWAKSLSPYIDQYVR